MLNTTNKAITSISRDTYDLFEDDELSHLLTNRGVDLSRKIRYELGSFWGTVFVYYDDTFIGENI